MKELDTYADLLEYLKTLTPEQLQQKVQYAPHSPITEQVLDIQPCIAIGTMDELEFYAARSSTNNRFNPHEIVFLTDYNPFGEDGATGYQSGPEDNYKSEKVIYGPDGPTPKKDQINPNFFKPGDEGKLKFSRSSNFVLKHRMKRDNG